MRPRTLGLLAAGVLLLAAFILFVERDLPTTDERREQATRVLDLDPESIQQLRIEWDDQRVILERRAPSLKAEASEPTRSTASTRWMLVEPWVGRADRDAVHGLIDTLANLRHRRRLDDDVDLAALGLDDPVARLTLVEMTGESRTLVLGAPLPASRERMLVIAGQPGGVVIEGPLVDDLTRPPEAWRDRRLFEARHEAVDTLRFTLGDEVVTLVRRDSAKGVAGLRDAAASFWLEAPIEDRADQQAVDRLLATLVALEAQRFFDPDGSADLAQSGSSVVASTDGWLEVTLDGQDRPWRLELLGTDPLDSAARVARVGGQTVTLDTALSTALGASVTAWRSRAWTPVPVYAIDSLHLSDDLGTVEIARDGIDWRRDGERIATTVATDLLDALVAARARPGAEDQAMGTVLDRGQAEAAGFDLSTALWTLHLATDGGGETLSLHPPSDGIWPATSDTRPAVLLMPEKTIDDLRARIEALRAASPSKSKQADPVGGP